MALWTCRCAWTTQRALPTCPQQTNSRRRRASSRDSRLTPRLHRCQKPNSQNASRPGRHQIGMVGEIISESWARSNRYTRARSSESAAHPRHLRRIWRLFFAFSPISVSPSTPKVPLLLLVSCGCYSVCSDDPEAFSNAKATIWIFLAAHSLICATSIRAEEGAPSRFDSIYKSARDMIPAMPAISSPSMPAASLPDISDPSGKLMAEFNSFTEQVGSALPLLEQMGYEVVTFKVTWGLPPKARAEIEREYRSAESKCSRSKGPQQRTFGIWSRHERGGREESSEQRKIGECLPRCRLCNPAAPEHEVRRYERWRER
ncbi:hypothetical protein J2R80_003217 [Bradyrhizobium sp. USDA 4541]|nr:hypothetical protein [Bradyrhizobium sp. USDA 4541]